MSEPHQYEFTLPGERVTNHRLRRGVYLLPSFLTVANLLCGFYAVLAALEGGQVMFDAAAKAIGFAVFFDSLDGTVARMTRSSTEFGKQFDSLADVISFGVAPAVLAYSWGARSLLGHDLPPVRYIVQFAWLVCLAFVICCAWRLARFNVHGMAPGGSRYFVGMPTPAAAGMVAATVHAVKAPIEDWRWSLALVLLLAFLAALMTSSLRFYSFKDFQWTRRHHSLTFVLIAVLAAAILVNSEVALMLLATSYALAGLVMHLVRWLRRHRAAHPA